MERDFKGVWIPKEIWLDTRLNALDKVILAEIDSLDKGEEGCWASNQYIADFCQCSASKVSTSVSKLIEYGYLYVKSFDGRTRVLKSRLSNFERQNKEISKADCQNLKDTNISTKPTTNKVTKKESNYDAIVSSFVEDENVACAIYDFIKMRKMIKKPLTDRALKMLINKLYKMAKDPEEQIAILEQSILKNWSDIYEVKKGEILNAKYKQSNKRDGSEFSEYD